MARSLIEINTQSILDISKEIEKLNSSMKTSLSIIAAKDKELHLKNLDQNKKEFNSQLEIISSIKPEKPKPVVEAPPLIEAPPPEPEKKEEEEKKPAEGAPGTGIPGGGLPGGGLPGGGVIPYVAPGAITPVITGRYGEIRKSGAHGGSDLAVPDGTPLRAISDGKIVDSGVDPGGWGNFLVYLDDKGIYHLYGHIQGGYRTSGAIKKGDIIAKVGMTGRTTGPHLHWETGTGWNGGVLTGKFDPLNRYSMNAPFSTAKDAEKPKAEPAEKKAEPQKLSAEPSKPKTIVATVPQPQQTAQVIPNNASRDVLQPVNNSNASSFSREQLIFATV